MLAAGAAYRFCWRTTCIWRPGSYRGSPRRLRSSCPSPDTDNVKPLDGVKILDLTRVLAGPFSTMNLGDLGAEVIKVERPGAGDDTRTWGPPFGGLESIYFLSVNRNKKSISVNIKHPKGRQIIRELAAVCDVLVENYVPGKLSEMGLGYEDLKEVAPHIIYCSITGQSVATRGTPRELCCLPGSFPWPWGTSKAAAERVDIPGLAELWHCARPGFHLEKLWVSSHSSPRWFNVN